jgi:hypothetical protein
MSPGSAMPPTVADVVARALDAMDALVATAEPVDDEWQYVADLRTVWGARISAVAEPRAGEEADPSTVAAIDALCRAAAAVSDPHRAIDWLSTLPQATLLALGEAPS